MEKTRKCAFLYRGSLFALIPPEINKGRCTYTGNDIRLSIHCLTCIRCPKKVKQTYLRTMQLHVFQKCSPNCLYDKFPTDGTGAWTLSFDADFRFQQRLPRFGIARQLGFQRGIAHDRDLLSSSSVIRLVSVYSERGMWRACFFLSLINI